MAQDVIFFEFKVYWRQWLVARDHSVIHVARSPKSSVACRQFTDPSSSSEGAGSRDYRSMQNTW